jgi:DNA-binding response OmpR family regulator
MMRILVVEDERELADSLAEGLRGEGYIVDVAYDGAEALIKAGQATADVILLDRDLPVMHGDVVSRALTSQGYPGRILMLTAASDLEDKVSGLDLGADDYLTKPFAYVELLARIRALGRRSGADHPTVLSCGDLHLDTVRRVAERGGTPLHLTPKEFAVLEYLMRADGGYVTVRQLLEDVWDDFDGERDRGVVKITIHTLRAKLGEPGVIHNSPGHGYRIGEPE